MANPLVCSSQWSSCKVFTSPRSFQRSGVVALLWISVAAGCRKSDQVQINQTVNSSSASATLGPNFQTRATDSTEVQTRFRLEDRTESLGVSFAYSNGEDAGLYSIVESLGGGVALFDFDGDRKLDIFATGGGRFHGDRTTSGLPNGLFRNLGDRFENIASLAVVEMAQHYTHGVSVGDFNNDGFRDVLTTGYGGIVLFQNMGDGSFQSVASELGLRADGCTTSAAWADFNSDSNLDLYIARYVNWSFDNNPICKSSLNGQRDICPPSSFDPVSHLLFLGDGQGGFQDVTSTNGLRSDGKGLGVVGADVDNDGDMDLYVANDTTDNFLYLNDGQGRFNEVGILHGVARDDRGLPNGSMGVAAYDYDNNGLIDLWVANYERESYGLYQNQGDGQFLHMSRRTGVTALGGAYVGFGTEMVDLDFNGTPEIVCTNGHVIKFPSAAPRQQLPLLISYDGKRFTRQNFEQGHYFSRAHEGRGLVVGDIDHNGTQDVVLTNLNQPLSVLLNQTPSENRGVRIRLIGTQSSRDAFGARLVFHFNEQEHMRQVVSGGSYLSSSDRDVWMAIPKECSDVSLTIHWPGGNLPQELKIAQDEREITIIQPF